MAINIDMMSLNRKIRVGLGFSLMILIFSLVVSFYSINSLIDKIKWVDHTNEVLLKLEILVTQVSSAESGVRGYAITDDAKFLDTYNASKINTFGLLKEVNGLTSDNGRQQDILKGLETEIRKKFEILDIAIHLHASNYDANLTYVFQDGKTSMDRVLKIISNSKHEEERLLNERTITSQLFSTSSQVIIIISSLISILVAGLSLSFINRDLKSRKKAQDELNELNAQLNQSNEVLTQNRNELKNRNYLLSGLTQFNELVRDKHDLTLLGTIIINHLCEFINSQVGLIYIADEDGQLNLSSSHALPSIDNMNKKVAKGEGLIGQAAVSHKHILLSDIPADAIRIESGLFLAKPKNILIVPFVYNQQTVAVAEFIGKDEFQEIDIEYISSLNDNICIVINRLNSEIKTLRLLEETQVQSEELEAQQEELRQVNDELREQRNRLESSEEELKANEEELKEKNSELQEKAVQLEEQFETLKFKNIELEEAKEGLKMQMEQVQSVSKYKSEFLANMSHELRTPLNSILILSKILKDNNNKNLTQKQTEHAEVIEKSGNDLLRLINEILDLARIESGKVKLELQNIPLKDLGIEQQFKEIAAQRKIGFSVSYANKLPDYVHSDKFRLEQVLKNLLSNAFKFTPENGTVELKIFTPGKEVSFMNDRLKNTNVIGFSVKDSGIGISKDKQQIIFEAFQQADSSTTRKFGGTGLGLSISRELALLLGGEIQLESLEKVGSNFTLYLPEVLDKYEEHQVAEVIKPPVPVNQPVFQKKSANVAPEKNQQQLKSILIVEDDVYFKKILEDFATSRGYTVYAAETGKEGLRLASQFIPGAILLDVQLPDITGWQVLESLKNTENLKNIPVHVMSAFGREAEKEDSGHVEFLSKPVSLEMLDKAFNVISSDVQKPLQKILIVEDNEVENNAVKELLATQNIAADAAFNGKDAMRMLNEFTYDCVILDINLPDIGGYDLLEKIKSLQKFKDLYVIIYSGKDLSEIEEAQFKKYTNTIIIKTEYSYTRLLEEIKLFLHNIHQNLYKKMPAVAQFFNKQEFLKNKKVLVVDDDIRNIYSLNDVLEQEGMKIVVAYDGKQALAELDKVDDIDIVLMDVMMPEMDGIEATQKIRASSKYKNVPIIALTAKAMKGDREKCIDAGASDYISKPVDVDKLLSLMRVWLYDKANKYL